MHMMIVRWAENTATPPTSYFSLIVPRPAPVSGRVNLMCFLRDNSTEDIAKRMTIATTEVDTVLDSLSKTSAIDRGSHELHLFATSKGVARLQVEEGEFDLEKLGVFLSTLGDNFHPESVNMLEFAPIIPRGVARFFPPATVTAASGVDEADEEARLAPK